MRDQIDQRTFSGTARTDYCQDFSRIYFQVDVRQRLARRPIFFVVSKTHIFELNGFRKLRQWQRFGLLGHRVSRVHELEQLLRCAKGLLEAVVEHGELADRVVQTKNQRDESAE